MAKGMAMAKRLLIKAIVVTIIGGIVATDLSMIFPIVQSMPFGTPVLWIVIALILAVVLAKYKAVKIDKISIFDLAVLLALIAAIGTALTTVMPTLAPFVLSVGQAFTVEGLLLTLLYIALTEWLVVKTGIKALQA